MIFENPAIFSIKSLAFLFYFDLCPAINFFFQITPLWLIQQSGRNGNIRTFLHLQIFFFFNSMLHFQVLIASSAFYINYYTLICDCKSCRKYPFFSSSVREVFFFRKVNLRFYQSNLKILIIYQNSHWLNHVPLFGFALFFFFSPNTNNIYFIEHSAQCIPWLRYRL